MLNHDQIIISGASGFVGRHILPYLVDKNLKVISLSRKRTKENTLTYNDIQEKDWNKASAFIHLAGKAHDVKNTADPEEYFKVNRDLTIDLFDQFLASDCKTFIFLSSVKAAADQVEGILTEEHIPKPKTAYGLSKQEAEQYLLKHIHRTDKKVIILRPCMIHGPGNKGNLNLLYSLVKKNVPYPLGGYHNQRSFLSITSLKQVILECITQPPASGIYNVADDVPLSTLALVRVIGKVLNKKPLILKVPAFIMNTVARGGTLLNLPFNSNSLQKLTENYVVSNYKLKKALNIADPWDTAHGLEKTIESFESKE
ncbi:NAD-dependent epimerase/dehydratase family protein [Nonlabens marinus]|uniref:UDP-glucose 4-epimerase n=1 Tax=Nonlabens marinus S1-08 TaxID=1454201 RepID=W8VWY6_9FLAO|nr:NAD-dependent epimerase/dehydratase family protein [Nonlabens marinus]BAO56728.1 UDP-glucose 4-epimerase [Nonlabens marinus S1-08]